MLAVTGGVVAAVGSALCCAGPLVAVALGLSGAGLAATFEPLRPYFVAGTVLSLGAGFAVLRREDQRACDPGTLCASPVARRRMKLALWIATAIAIPLLTFPWWSKFVLS
jgi:mercuric ion transport protein